MNTFLNEMTNKANFGLTENGAVKHLHTKSAVLDLFALGGAYRKRSEDDCILLFKNAFAEDATLALKCLFYLGDCRGGQGERRFFRVCFHWFAQNYPNHATELIEHIPTFRRWDDVLYATKGTRVQDAALSLIKHQLALDVESQTPSLLAKWLPSENASSEVTRKMGTIVREYLGMTHRQYRKTLSILRSRINIVEKLMSEGRWDEIEFDKIPSRAGIIYKNAFARRDIIAKKYEAFAKDTTTKVNAEVLNPVDIAERVFSYKFSMNDKTDRAILQKYWDNLKDYYNGRQENGIAVVDVSGSMRGTPMNAAVSMGAYIAERGHGPFANHFITFSAHPSLVKFEGVDIADKFTRAKKADWGYNTNIEAVFDMLLKTATAEGVKPEDIPETLYVFSDMEFDEGLSVSSNEGEVETLLERIAKKWAAVGYELPRVVFWNLDARTDNIPATGGRFSYVSGFNMNMIEQILSGEDGYSLMLKKLLSERYEVIQ